jgi:glycosyltransferase involved in cell wall biosynthesis
VRILFATTYGHLPDITGGLQTTMDELARALTRRGHDVSLLCSSKFGDDADGPGSADERYGYRTVRLPEPIESLPSVAASFEPDIVVVQTGITTIPMLVAALDIEIPVALYMHNVEVSELGGQLVPDPKLLYFANSAFTADRGRAMFGIDMIVLPPLVERSRYRIASSRETALFINPTPLKGVEIVLQLAERCPRVPFSIVESWQIPKEWRRFIRQRTAALTNLTWNPATNRICDHLGAARVLLMPSVWEETYGRTATEAQLSGIPVLASDRGNLPDTVGPGGVIVPAHAPVEDWQAALERMWESAVDYAALSEAAIRHAERDELSETAIVGRLVSALERHCAS